MLPTGENPNPFPQSKMAAVFMALTPGPMFLGELWVSGKWDGIFMALILILTAVVYTPLISFFMGFRITHNPNAGSTRNILIGLLAAAGFLVVNLAVAAAGCGAAPSLLAD